MHILGTYCLNTMEEVSKSYMITIQLAAYLTIKESFTNKIAAGS